MLDCLTREDGTDRSSLNVGNCQFALCNVPAERSIHACGRLSDSSAMWMRITQEDIFAFRNVYYIRCNLPSLP